MFNTVHGKEGEKPKWWQRCCRRDKNKEKKPKKLGWIMGVLVSAL